jgi:murein DD-endopeptidase MepM/ murein hydrolase activator NlpD
VTRPLRAAVLWFFAGALFVSSAFFVVSLQEKWFLSIEPYFGSPVVTPVPFLKLRRDSNGKGHFGASRNGGRKHKGIDLALRVGEPVLAAKSGRVLFAGAEKGYGNWIEIAHPDGRQTRYAHLLSLAVEEGAWVRAGRLIGYSGKTGNADGPDILPHLHFEIRSGGDAVDPSKGFLDPSLVLAY